MKDGPSICIGLVLGGILGYLVAAFIFWEVDPGEYGLWGRLFALTLIILCAGIVGTVFDTVSKKGKSK